MNYEILRNPVVSTANIEFEVSTKFNKLRNVAA